MARVQLPSINLFVIGVMACASIARAQTTELEETLFIQTPVTAGFKGIVFVWIPQPIEKLCLGKTVTECASMDFCIRTTTKSVKMCQNLPMPLARLPQYPPNIRPARVISMTLQFPATLPGVESLRQFMDNAPKETLNRLSLSARVKAKIKFTRTPDDDTFWLEEVLSILPR
jgi:hypothetical protein